MSSRDALPHGLAPVRAGEEQDWESLTAYLRQLWPELSADPDVWQFTTGAANLTFLFDYETMQLVVRRPPLGTVAAGAHDMQREGLVLSRLCKVYERAPATLHHCTDTQIIGSEFLVLEFRDGVVIQDRLPPEMETLPNAAARVGLAVVDALCDLHAVEPNHAGLGQLGRPDGYVARQVRGWQRRWDAVDEGGATGELMREVGSRLEGHLPSPQRASILHNDFKPDNCQFRPYDPDVVTSVFDWDMATLGDPLTDLGLLLAYWPAGTADEYPSATFMRGLEDLGLPARSQVLDRYSDRTGLDVSPVGWYESFAYWRTAVTHQQLHARFRQGHSSDPRLRDFGDRAATLAEWALATTEDW